MFPKRRHTPLAPDELRNLPVVRTVTAELRCEPQRLFDSFGTPSELKRWLDLDVEWLDADRGPGVRRTIGAFPLYATERFTVWDAPHRMSFCFDESSLVMVRTFGEEWAITPTSDGCRFEWTLGLKMGRGAGWLGSVIADMVADTISDGIPELRRIVE